MLICPLQIAADLAKKMLRGRHLMGPNSLKVFYALTAIWSCIDLSPSVSMYNHKSHHFLQCTSARAKPGRPAPSPSRSARPQRRGRTRSRPPTTHAAASTSKSGYPNLYRAQGISWVKGSVCFVLKFELPTFSPPLPSGVQISKQIMH